MSVLAICCKALFLYLCTEIVCVAIQRYVARSPGLDQKKLTPENRVHDTSGKQKQESMEEAVGDILAEVENMMPVTDFWRQASTLSDNNDDHYNAILPLAAVTSKYDDDKDIEALVRDTISHLDQITSGEFLKVEHTTNSVQDRDNSSHAESEICAASEYIMQEDVDEKENHADESGYFPLAASVSQVLTNPPGAEEVGGVSEVSHECNDSDTVSDKTEEYYEEDVVSVEYVHSDSEEGNAQVKSVIVDISSDDDLPDTAAEADAVVNDVSVTSVDNDGKPTSDELTEAVDAAADEKDDIVGDNSTSLLSVAGVLKEQESSVIQLLKQADEQSSEASDVGQEAAEMMEDSHSLMPSTEVLEFLPNVSTVCDHSSEMVKVSSSVSGAESSDKQTEECGEQEGESAEIGNSLSSGDQPDVQPVNDCELVSAVVIQEHGGVAEDACDVDHNSPSQEAAEMMEDSHSLMPSTEVLEFLSTDSTVCGQSSEVMKVSSSVSGAESFTPADCDKHTEESDALNVEQEGESAEIGSSLSSDDQPDVQPVSDSEPVSAVVIQEHGGVDEETLLSASQNIMAAAATADDDDDGGVDDIDDVDDDVEIDDIDDDVEIDLL